MGRHAGAPGRPRDREVDFVVVNPATTTGWQVSARALSRSLQERGYTVAELDSPPDRLRRAAGRWGYVSPVMDLVEALAVRRAMDRAVEHGLRFRWVIYMTTTAALLEPRGRQRLGVLRVDALAAQNRRGRRNAVVRQLERRSLRRVVSVWSMDPSCETGRHRPDRFRFLPPLISASTEGAEPAEHEVLTYANGPKKRPGLLLDAWEAAGLAAEGWRLTVAGCAPEQLMVLTGRRSAPDGVDLPGLLTTEEFRAATRRSAVFLAAPEFEDFGIAPLEAMADGCVLVTTRSPGAYTALRLAEEVTPELVAGFDDAAALGAALARAARLNQATRAGIAGRLSDAVVGFGQEMFGERLDRALAQLDGATNRQTAD